MRIDIKPTTLFTMKIIRTIFATAVLLLSPAGAYAMPASGEMTRPGVDMATLPVVKVINGHVEIHLTGDESRQVVVFALTGQQVKTVTANPGVTVIDLPAGYYIVKCDRLSQRVIVR